MKISRHQLRRIIREAITPHNFNGEHGTANVLLQLYLTDDLVGDELQSIREDMSSDDIEEVIAIYEGLIAVLTSLLES